MFKQKLTFKNSRNLNLAAIFEGEDKNAPVVIVCHGFGSSKDSISYKNLVPKLLKRGLSVFRFDFTGCGQSEGKLDNLTPLRGLDDLKSVIKNLGQKQFALYGSSFGGHVALMYASKNPILALALKSPVSDYGPIAKNRPAGRSKSFYDEVKNIGIYKDARKIKAPVFIVHGDKDDVVPISQSQKLLKALDGQKRLEVVKGADHDIAGEDLERTNTLIADFFKENLLK